MSVIVPALNYDSRASLRQSWRDFTGKHDYDFVADLTFAYQKSDPVVAQDRFYTWHHAWLYETAAAAGQIATYPAHLNGHFGSALPADRWSGSFHNAYKRGKARSIFVAAIEYKWTGECHIHALIKQSLYLPPLDPRRGQRIWQGGHKEGGLAYGNARVEHIRDQVGARNYRTKNNIHGEVEFIVSTNF